MILQFENGENVDLSDLTAVKSEPKVGIALQEPNPDWNPSFTYAQLRTVHNAGGTVAVSNMNVLEKLYEAMNKK